MIKPGVYTINELRVISEATKSEFKPKLGKNVERDNKKNNEKAVNDIIDDVNQVTKDAKGEKNKRPANDVHDFNKTLLDLNYNVEPDKTYKDRVKAQVHGYPSVENEKAHKDDDEEATRANKEFYKTRSEVAKDRNEREANIRAAGLKAQHYPKETFKNKSVFSENKKMKRLHFKNTVFLSESQVFSKVPDTYKTDGNKFIMKDKIGNEYLIECLVDERFGFTKLQVLNKYNKKSINEQLDRMRDLADYSSAAASGKGNVQERMNEDKTLGLMIEHVRNTEKQNLND